MQKSLEIRLSVFGEMHHEVGNTYFNIGDTYKSLGRYREALEVYEKANMVFKGVHGLKHSQTKLSEDRIAEAKEIISYEDEEEEEEEGA